MGLDAGDESIPRRAPRVEMRQRSPWPLELRDGPDGAAGVVVVLERGLDAAEACVSDWTDTRTKPSFASPLHVAIEASRCTRCTPLPSSWTAVGSGTHLLQKPSFRFSHGRDGPSRCVSPSQLHPSTPSAKTATKDTSMVSCQPHRLEKNIMPSYQDTHFVSMYHGNPHE